jgi:hypothetical protein
MLINLTRFKTFGSLERKICFFCPNCEGENPICVVCKRDINYAVSFCDGKRHLCGSCYQEQEKEQVIK